MTRAAWGRTIRRIVLPVGHPERLGRLRLAGVDRQDAGPHDLAHVGALVDAEGEDAGLDGALEVERAEQDVVREAVDPAEQVRRPK